ncbi:MAG: hypothetical protein GY905_05875 [Gammaproteobacteria bacterium]|nr:hypothetical protein [Gammaproteobacteria bacterium]MDP6164914.1 hypothetical protein [Gammaproteobacteria bacterium]
MQPLDLHLKPSRLLAGSAIIVWAVLLALFISTQPPWWQSVGVATMALWHLLVWLRRYAWLQTPDGIQRLHVSVHGWRVYLQDGRAYDVELASGCRFLPALIVLRLQAPGRPMLWWLLMADSAEAGALRRLRVFGRWFSTPSCLPQK